MASWCASSPYDGCVWRWVYHGTTNGGYWASKKQGQIPWFLLVQVVKVRWISVLSSKNGGIHFHYKQLLHAGTVYIYVLLFGFACPWHRGFHGQRISLQRHLPKIWEHQAAVSSDWVSFTCRALRLQYGNLQKKSVSLEWFGSVRYFANHHSPTCFWKTSGWMMEYPYCLINPITQLVGKGQTSLPSGSARHLGSLFGGPLMMG